ncbi:heme exporter protein CcmB [Oecophyllibacter saccharovorans]|uniref:heme exporter protein CcmB n=1 Tax=Oecophyllibacter saccharovorans TaxID=2558360 RepID=UPI0011445618|nr:heme exporter protein CcmB [Oecophyllibacter saccharovorans]QDH15454.1 heme exporter protein CcmB [Oecophyllibacter saccharovorans]TPW36475.1 heme exporter protein CcmB [Oecophyllibacter saccharovorans]
MTGRSQSKPRELALFGHVLRRDLLMARRFGGDTLAGVLFFVLCASLFPLALGPSPALLAKTAPGLIWVCALLASLLSLEKIFQPDLEDGALDQLMLSGLSPAALALAKITAHWLCSALPLLAAALPLLLMFGLPLKSAPLLLGSLALGTMGFSLLGGMGAAIALGARFSSVLLPMLVLPLCTPLLIFGTIACSAPLQGLSPTTGLEFLGAFFCAALPLCPLLAGIGLREACR